MRPALAVVVALSACSSVGLSPAGARACTSDDECGDGQVCFAEGCGDPGTSIVVEVSGDALKAQYPKDFAIEDGTLGPERNFDLGEPVAIRGELARLTAPAAEPVSTRTYADSVRIQAWGFSELLPGVVRSYDHLAVTPAYGRYELPVGAGRYEVTAIPQDQGVPPVVVSDVVVDARASSEVNFTFPSEEGAVVLEGRLLDHVDLTTDPPTQVAVTGVAADLQALDPVTRRPLSQRFEVSSGTAGSRGDFRMTISPAARSMDRIILRASPRSAGTGLPTKEFEVKTPLPRSVDLYFGDPGPLERFTARVVDAQGAPVASAQVRLDAQVRGGGTYTSAVVVTDASGSFAVKALRPLDAFRVTIVPPPGHNGALSELAAWPGPQGSLTPSVLAVGERLRLRGTVLGPQGLPQGGVIVHAAEHGMVGALGRDVPLGSTQARTDALGTFELFLDPGEWRLELRATGLPLASRLVTLVPGPDLVRPLPEPLTLREGRRITGQVFAGPAGQRTVVPGAQLRFFRVGDGASPTPLGSTFADAKGSYSIILPTVPSRDP